MKQKARSAFIVGEWMWGSTIADAGPDGAAKIMSRCAEMGITDVYLLIKGTGGKLGYLRTGHTDLLIRTERDILEEAIGAAHARGIRLHAWICNMEDSAYKAAHPEAGMCHYIRARDNDRINLYDPGYRAHMADIASELAAYDINGLHFDYIRYNHLTNGWSETDFAALAAMGADPGRIRELIESTFGYHGCTADSQYIFNAYRNGDRDARLIAEYRRNMVREYAASVIAAARAVRPELIISAATMPEGAYDEAFAALHYGQDYRDAAALYDYICPMAYSTSYGKDAGWIRTVAENAIRMGNKVVMGLQAFGGVPSARLMEEIGHIRALAADSVRGIVLFRSSQFDYARITCTAADTLCIRTVSGSGDLAYTQIRIEVPSPLRIRSARVGDGYAADTLIQISEERSSVLFCGTDCITSGTEGCLYLQCEGDLQNESVIVRPHTGANQEITVFINRR